ncbi:MAG: hypothetical protein HKM04_02045 [Legionellales bacterium]|nr:hypothetical protein [Legionellales bacterium]
MKNEKIITNIKNTLEQLYCDDKFEYFYNQLCLLDESDRIDVIEQYSDHLDATNRGTYAENKRALNSGESDFLFSIAHNDSKLFLIMNLLPPEDRYRLIILFDKNPIKYRESHYFNVRRFEFQHFEQIALLLKALPEENWLQFFQNITLPVSKEDLKRNLQLYFFTPEQINRILNNVTCVSQKEFALFESEDNNQEQFDEQYAIWGETLLAIYQLLDDKLKFNDYLKPLDEKIKKRQNIIESPASVKKPGVIERFGYSYPDAESFINTPRQHNHRLLDEFLLEKEQKSGLNVPLLNEAGEKFFEPIAYFMSRIDDEVIKLFRKNYPNLSFKEIIINSSFLTHGNQTHRLQWYVILSAIESGEIRLPDNMSVSDLYNAFYTIALDPVFPVWAFILDWSDGHHKYNFHNPHMLHSYLLTEARDELPNLSAYLQNTFFKKLERTEPIVPIRQDYNRHSGFLPLEQSSQPQSLLEQDIPVKLDLINPAHYEKFIKLSIHNKLNMASTKYAMRFTNVINTAKKDNANRLIYEPSELKSMQSSFEGIFFKKPIAAEVSDESILNVPQPLCVA